MGFGLPVRAWQLAFRASLAATAALLIAEAIGLPGPIYAMISAVMVTDVEAARTRELAIPRVLGTVVGSVLGGLLAPATAAGLWTIGLGIAAAMLVAHGLRKPDAAKLAGYLCGLVMFTHGADAWGYAWWRFVETLLGIATALAVSFIPRLLEARPPKGGP